MSDSIKHECGIALLKLKKPLSFYIEKYGTAFYGLNKLHLLMEKQHNRGQDGAGVANIKFDVKQGERYISRIRSAKKSPIQDVFTKINSRFLETSEKTPHLLKDSDYLKKNFGFTGELFLGHLRYGTFGRNSIESCHPFLRQNNWITRNLVVAGNFNLTNVDELFDVLVRIGQHPKEKSDTVTVMEKIGHFLDVENDEMFRKYSNTKLNNREIYNEIAKKIDIAKILQRASEDWDGGYAMAGLLGHGDAFVLRDPNGIRPVFWYEDDEVSVVTSERPVIQTVFNVSFEKIKELTPGHALILKKSGSCKEVLINEPNVKKACSFERIYFSRGSDKDIYKERKLLGRNLVSQVIESIQGDINNSVFSFIPNTAEVSFYGLVEGLQDSLNQVKQEEILNLKKVLNSEELKKILNKKVRTEKIAIKDAKLRTFITQDDSRDDLVAHVYDITYGTIKPQKDNLVVIDDSIVRGTTLKQSILKILDRLNPKKIVVVSSAPQIRYPDCYGIDMARLGDFVAFEAAIELLKSTNKESIIEEVYKKCLSQKNLPKEKVKNYVKEIYKPFSAEEISEKIAEILTPPKLRTKVEIIYQKIENLHKSCPNNKGDWYFSGNYPTPGGNKVVNKAFINWKENIKTRAY